MSFARGGASRQELLQVNRVDPPYALCEPKLRHVESICEEKPNNRLQRVGDVPIRLRAKVLQQLLDFVIAK